MLNTILTIGVSFLITLFLTPLVIAIAKRFKIYDVPGGRKSHDRPTPLLGGVAIFAGTAVSVMIFGASAQQYAVPVVVAGGAGVAFMGLIDDISNLSARRRLGILFIAALIVYFGCLQYYFYGSDLYLPGDTFARVMFSAYIIIWIVAVTNAVNFADGLDGLASYLSLVSIIAFAVLFCIEGRVTLTLTLTLALGGAVAGFIPYNRNPAIVFMGDAGSMFIGFMMSMLSITSIAREATLFAVIVPVFILFVPLLDMALSIVRRRARGISAMEADHEHFHHRLHGLFHNQIAVVIILSLAQTVFAGLGIYIYVFKIYAEGWIIAGTLFAAAAVYTVVSERRKRHRFAGA